MKREVYRRYFRIAWDEGGLVPKEYWFLKSAVKDVCRLAYDENSVVKVVLVEEDEDEKVIRSRIVMSINGKHLQSPGLQGRF